MSDIKGRSQTEGDWEQGADENTWTHEGWNNMRVQKMTE
jgi:hypothetical protein